MVEEVPAAQALLARRALIWSYWLRVRSSSPLAPFSSGIACRAVDGRTVSSAPSWNPIALVSRSALR
jgi:hypothetical protein